MQIELFRDISEIKSAKAQAPKGYSGLHSMHKYWGKKPSEPIEFLISSLSNPGDIVLDPFLGYGVSGLESLRLKRRFLGVDVNPAAIHIAKFVLSPPSAAEIAHYFEKLSSLVKDRILSTYESDDGRTATHYLWADSEIEQVWSYPGTRKEIRRPSEVDRRRIADFSEYESRNLAELKFFHNSRINTKSTMDIYSLFTRRALYNIDLLYEAIATFPVKIQDAFKFALTASIGQMSNMVFAIKNRRHKQHDGFENYEVGSWVIGYWVPKQHFEVNVWNCFDVRFRKLLKGLKDSSPEVYAERGGFAELCDSADGYFLAHRPAQHVLEELETNSIDLIITDPPHSDRIPYLELSNLWNAVLKHDVDYENEIVISNARERNKSKEQYYEDMKNLFQKIERILRPGKFMAFIYNSRDNESWRFIDEAVESSNDLQYLGFMPLPYSAGSVIQDNREGGLTHDLTLFFSKGKAALPEVILSAAEFSQNPPIKGYTVKNEVSSR